MKKTAIKGPIGNRKPMAAAARCRTRRPARAIRCRRNSTGSRGSRQTYVKPPSHRSGSSTGVNRGAVPMRRRRASGLPEHDPFFPYTSRCSGDIRGAEHDARQALLRYRLREGRASLSARTRDARCALPAARCWARSPSMALPRAQLTAEQRAALMLLAQQCVAQAELRARVTELELLCATQPSPAAQPATHRHGAAPSAQPAARRQPPTPRSSVRCSTARRSPSITPMRRAVSATSIRNTGEIFRLGPEQSVGRLGAGRASGGPGAHGGNLG